MHWEKVQISSDHYTFLLVNSIALVQWNSPFSPSPHYKDVFIRKRGKSDENENGSPSEFKQFLLVRFRLMILVILNNFIQRQNLVRYLSLFRVIRFAIK